MKLAKEEKNTIAETKRKREAQKERKYESVSGALQIRIKIDLRMRLFK